MWEQQHRWVMPSKVWRHMGLEKTTERDCGVLDARPPHLDSVRHTAMDLFQNSQQTELRLSHMMPTGEFAQ